MREVETKKEQKRDDMNEPEGARWSGNLRWHEMFLQLAEL